MEQVGRKQGIFYGVGVGPGDPELLTFRAVQVLQQCKVIAVPKSGGESELALNIIRSHVDLTEKILLPLDFPMKREFDLEMVHREQAEKIQKYLDLGEDVVLPNLGDVSIYSTFGYMKKYLETWGYSICMVPGVTSFCAVAAALNQILAEGNQPLHIIPAGYKESDSLTALSGTKILMKAGRGLQELLNQLDQEELLQNTSMVQNCGLPNEVIYPKITSQMNPEASYFTTLIIRETKK